MSRAATHGQAAGAAAHLTQWGTRPTSPGSLDLSGMLWLQIEGQRRALF